MYGCPKSQEFTQEIEKMEIEIDKLEHELRPIEYIRGKYWVGEFVIFCLMKLPYFKKRMARHEYLVRELSLIKMGIKPIGFVETPKARFGCDSIQDTTETKITYVRYDKK